jgi:hypothetical protein
MEKFLILAALFVFMLSVFINLVLILSTLPDKNRTIRFLQTKMGDCYDAGFHSGWEKHRGLLEPLLPPAADSPGK